MKIANISSTHEANYCILKADITFKNKKTEKAYLKISDTYKDFLVSDASPFLAAVLLPCMKSGESIEIDGTVSQDLLDNTKKIMTLVHSWDIGLKPVEITVKDTDRTVYKTTAVASFFTAGVDSFYTYTKHKKDKQPIDHVILAHGFDIPLSNQSFFEQVSDTVSEVAEKEHISAIFIETNIGEIIERRLVWDYSHGGALAAVAHFLRAGIKTLYIPGAVRDDQLFPYGTHPELDKLWSTKTMSVSSDGGEYDRIQKITEGVSHDPLALQYLRVCTQNIKGKYNCSRCYKCLITMIYLACADALHKAKTFDTDIDLAAVKRMYYDYKLKYNIQGEMALALLQKSKRNPELQEAIAFSLEKSKKTKLQKRVANAIAVWDQRYNDRRLYEFIFKMNNKEDRNFIFTFLSKRGLLK